MSDERMPTLDGSTAFPGARAGEGSATFSNDPDDEGFGRFDWDGLHRRIQGELERLWDRVARRVPTALSRPGKVSAANMPLYSYRTFHRRSWDEYDPIIAGVLVQLRREGPGYKVIADVGGEESGVTFAEFTGDGLTVATPSELDRAIAPVLAGIAAADDVVCEALATPVEEPRD